ncbi:MAG: M48 family metalloprotease [Oligoflexia bacterium]|nr:M48 family metalloprotease [Oligoflexia bacterium]
MGMGIRLLFALSMAVGTFAHAQNQDQTQVHQKATQLLTELMASSELSESFKAAQMNLLRTPVDLQMHIGLSTNPMIAHVSPLFDIVAKNNVKEAINRGLLGMTEATSSVYGDIRLLAENVASDLGYSKEQISNLRVYVAQGPINAYTMATTKDNTVVVVFTDLKAKLDAEQLRAVMSHEMAHVVNEHILQGIKMSAMNLLLMNVFMGSGMEDQFEASDYAKIREKYLEEMYKIVFPHDAALSANQSVNSLQRMNRRLFNKAIFVMVESLNEIYKENPQEAISIIASYMDRLISNLNRLEVPARLLQSLTTLRANLPNRVIRYDAQFLLENLLLAGFIVGKEQETSCDRFALAAGTDPKKAASTFMVFAGGPEKTNDIDAMIKAKTQAVEEFYRTNSPELRAEILNGELGQTHPFSNIRSLNILYYAQSNPIAVMKHPVLRLMALYDQLRLQTDSMAQQVHMGTQRLEAIKKNPAEATKGLPPEAAAQIIASMETGLAEMKSNLQNQVTAANYLSFEFERLLGRLAPEDRLGLIRDFLDFHLASQQLARSVLGERLKKATSAQEKAVILASLEAAAAQGAHPWLKELAPQLAAAGSALTQSGGISAIEKAIEELINPAMSPREVRELREALRAAVPYKTEAEKALALALDPPTETPNAGAGNRMKGIAMEEAPKKKEKSLRFLRLGGLAGSKDCTSAVEELSN